MNIRMITKETMDLTYMDKDKIVMERLMKLKLPYLNGDLYRSILQLKEPLHLKEAIEFFKPMLSEPLYNFIKYGNEHNAFSYNERDKLFNNFYKVLDNFDWYGCQEYYNGDDRDAVKKLLISNGDYKVYLNDLVKRVLFNKVPLERYSLILELDIDNII